MNCPHCNKTIKEDFSIALRNCECYGSQYYHFRCKYCKQIYMFYIERSVKIKVDTIQESNRNYSDWGE